MLGLLLGGNLARLGCLGIAPEGVPGSRLVVLGQLQSAHGAICKSLKKNVGFYSIR